MRLTGNHRDALLVTTGLSATLETDYGYDAYGRMATVASGGNTANYGYLASSDLLQTTVCSNATSAVLTTSRQWDYGFRLRSIANAVSGTNVTSHAYAYDYLNRRTRATLEDGSMWNYSYDNRNQMSFTLLTCLASMGEFSLIIPNVSTQGPPTSSAVQVNQGRTLALITAGSLPTELEARPHLALKQFNLSDESLSNALRLHGLQTWFVGAGAHHD